MKLLTFTRKVYLILKFIFTLILDIIIANLRVTYEVLTPGSYAKPGVIAIPLNSKNPIEITLFSNIISLTPGTLTLDISSDHKFLYLHAMFIKDIDQLKNDLKQKYEKPILEIL